MLSLIPSSSHFPLFRSSCSRPVPCAHFCFFLSFSSSLPPSFVAGSGPRLYVLFCVVKACCQGLTQQSRETFESPLTSRGCRTACCYYGLFQLPFATLRGVDLHSSPCCTHPPSAKKEVVQDRTHTPEELRPKWHNCDAKGVQQVRLPWIRIPTQTRQYVDTLEQSCCRQWFGQWHKEWRNCGNAHAG